MTKKNLDVRVKKVLLHFFWVSFAPDCSENIRVICFAQNPESKRSVRRMALMSNKKPKLRVVEGNKRSKGTRKKSATNKSTGLTDKQEAFAMAIFEGNNFSDAYRLAYDASGMSNASVNVEACKLVKNPNVTLTLNRLEEDRALNNRMQRLSRSDRVIQKLEDIALRDGEADGTQVRALELLGKSMGMWIERVETEDKTERDPESIKAELEARLNRLLG